MGIIDRLLRLVRANVHHQLDQAERPGPLLEEILREEQAHLSRVRDRVRDMIALEKEIESGLHQSRGMVIEWARKAEAAVAAGRDDLAREALRRKRDSDENVRTGEQDVEVQRQVVGRLKDQLRTLESRHEATRRRKDVLVARHRRAEAQQSVAGQLAADTTSAEMAHIERKVRRVEAGAAASAEIAGSSLDAQLMSLNDPVIESELRELKERLASNQLDEEGDALSLDGLDQLDVPAFEAKPGALKSGQ